MTIKEAIEQVELFDASWGTCEQALEIVIAAARAYACKRCRGTGSVGLRIRNDHSQVLACPECFDARKYLKEHAK
jgi:hypothetical protein